MYKVNRGSNGTEQTDRQSLGWIEKIGDRHPEEDGGGARPIATYMHTVAGIPATMFLKLRCS